LHWPSSRLEAAVPDVIRHTALRSSDFPPPPEALRPGRQRFRVLTFVLQLKSFTLLAEDPNRSMVLALKEKLLFFCASHLFTFISHYVLVFPHHNTRTYVRLLGPCSKTGRLRPFFATWHLLRAFLFKINPLHSKILHSLLRNNESKLKGVTSRLEHKKKKMIKELPPLPPFPPHTQN